MFDSESAKKAGKKSKRGPAKKKLPGIKEKQEMLYDKVLDYLLENLDKLSESERLKLFVTLSSKVTPKEKDLEIKDTKPFSLKDVISFYDEE